MCLSIPGKVIEISGDGYLVDYVSEKRLIPMCVIDVSLGDYVIVSNKIIMTKVDPVKAKKYLEVINNF